MVLNSDLLATAAVGCEVSYVGRILDLAAYFLVVEGELAQGLGVDREGPSELGVLAAEVGDDVFLGLRALGVVFWLGDVALGIHLFVKPGDEVGEVPVEGGVLDVKPTLYGRDGGASAGLLGLAEHEVHSECEATPRSWLPSPIPAEHGRSS